MSETESTSVELHNIGLGEHVELSPEWSIKRSNCGLEIQLLNAGGNDRAQAVFDMGSAKWTFRELDGTPSGKVISYQSGVKFMSHLNRLFSELYDSLTEK